jgi:hypothetical protein
MATRDRRAELLRQANLNGIDFVEVMNAAQTHLRVHFLIPAPNHTALAASITKITITGGDAIPAVPVLPLTPASWAMTSGRPTVDLRVAAPGDFSSYTLRFVTEAPLVSKLDREFDHVSFTFKAGCPSTIDCEQPEPDCPPVENTAPPIDYLAKDFSSFCRALSDFSALRYPAWQERSEADFGVMFMEALSSVADDLSYQQDRIASEAWIESASERRSLVRLGRLVDYEPRVAVASRVFLQFEIAGTMGCSIPVGLAVSALAPDGTHIDFETGTHLDDVTSYLADPAWNAMQPYWWDDSQQCLRAGTTKMWIERPLRPLTKGQLILIDTTADPPADEPLRQIVQIVADPIDAVDLLFGTLLTQIEWRAQDELRADHDLNRTIVAANLVPATQGRRAIDTFIVSHDWPPATSVPRAIVRTGANRTPQFLHTLRQAPLAWLAQESPLEDPRPEISIIETTGNERREWKWRRSLLGAGEFEPAVTLDPMRYRTLDAASGAAEYDGDDGATLRFGDGVFGLVPTDDATFEVRYRSGGGSRGNVAAGAINRVDATHPFAFNVRSVRNPLAAAGGRDEEPDDQVREMAPQRFRARQYRAVRAEDYERAAMTLSWVQRAGTQFRHTGSWLSVFTTVDPEGDTALPDDGLIELTHLLDRYRLAGYEAFGLAPRYASLDLEIVVCARPDAFRADVMAALATALDSTEHADRTRGFFHPDRFTFGVPLERSELEAAIQDVPGVDGVVQLRYRRRGHTRGFVVMPDAVAVGRDEIVRVANDRNRPERGSLRIDVRGGK